ncbi:MAG: hypothetical protein V1905_00625 [bacterium]
MENIIFSQSIIKIFFLGAFSFAVAILITPVLTKYFYKYKLWRKTVRTESIDGKGVPIFQKLHAEGEIKTPRFGGMLIWIPTIITAGVFFLLSYTDISWLKKMNFLSRSQTWLPIFTLVTASLLGLADDFLQVFQKGTHKDKGLSVKHRLLLVIVIGLIGAYWFNIKLGWETINIPGIGDIGIGWLYIPLFVITMLAVYSGGVIDGIDGLSGGIFGSIFSAFGIIALWRGQVDLAAFCVVIVGSILAFLWFNIPPARFYMGESGILGLCASLAVVAFLSDSVLVLPIIAFPLVVESLSVIIQLTSKKFFHRKVFLAAPIHHHFEALGWPSYKVTMRFWVIGVVMAFIGVAVRLLG